MLCLLCAPAADCDVQLSPPAEQLAVCYGATTLAAAYTFKWPDSMRSATFVASVDGDGTACSGPPAGECRPQLLPGQMHAGLSCAACSMLASSL